MMKLASALYVGLLSLGLVTLSSSCAEDNLSGIGESIQPNRDKVTGLATTITFDATTVATPTLYTDGTTSLLGTLIDETGSTVTGEFIKQIRTAEGVAFEEADNAQLTIDSVYFRIYSDRTEGNADAQIKVNVYKLAQPVTTAGTSSQTLGQYRTGATLLGSATIQPRWDAHPAELHDALLHHPSGCEPREALLRCDALGDAEECLQLAVTL